MDVVFQNWVLSFVLLLARVGMFVGTMPFFGGAFIPRLIKSGLVLALTVFWFFDFGIGPAIFLRSSGHFHWFAFIVAIGREVIIGGVLGMTFSLFMVPFRIAGEFIGQEMGLTLATITDPTRAQFGTVFGEAFQLTGVLLFFSLNVHHVFLAAMHASLHRRPVGAGLGPVPVAQYVDAVAATQDWGLLLAGPIVCCLFVTTMVLALLARAAPQMNIMAVGFALRLVVGLIASVIFLPEIASSMRMVFERLTQITYSML